MLRPPGLSRTTLHLGLALLLAACQATTVVGTTPLPKDANGQPQYNAGYQLPAMLNDPKGEVLMALAFSGGGKRSAAFAFGALRGLHDMSVTENGVTRPLLDEVDYISAVSGGSFPAAYYGLHRDKGFATFPDDFLYRDINAYIWGTYLLPWNWEWLVNPFYGTNDRMAEVYDRLMFHGATYADLLHAGLPVISINATDIANGVSFPFVQASFNLICDNLLTFPVARAVAASNGFPVLFTPITLRSHRNDCGPPPPQAARLSDASEQELSRRAALGRIARIYLDGKRTQYVHLMDGGIADNLALRGLLNGLLTVDEQTERARRVAHATRRVLLVSVDGQAATDPTLGQKRVVTGLGQIFSAVSGTQIDAYNFETELLASQSVATLVKQIRDVRCADAPILDGYPCDDVQGRFVHISLNDVSDPEVRARLQAIPTGLTIPRADVDLLVEWGERLVRENPDIHAMTQGLDAKPAEVAQGRAGS